MNIYIQKLAILEISENNIIEILNKMKLNYFIRYP